MPIFQSLHIAMHSSSAADVDVHSDIFTVTVLDHNSKGYITQPLAFKWAITIIRTATKEADTSFEGELYKVIPLMNTVTGKKYKLHFVGVPEQLMKTVIIPAFEREGQVMKFSKDEELHDKATSARRAADTKARAPTAWTHYLPSLWRSEVMVAQTTRRRGSSQTTP